MQFAHQLKMFQCLWNNIHSEIISDSLKKSEKISQATSLTNHDSGGYLNYPIKQGSFFDLWYVISNSPISKKYRSRLGNKQMVTSEFAKTKSNWDIS